MLIVCSEFLWRHVRGRFCESMMRYYTRIRRTYRCAGNVPSMCIYDVYRIVFLSWNRMPDRRNVWFRNTYCLCSEVLYCIFSHIGIFRHLLLRRCAKMAGVGDVNVCYAKSASRFRERCDYGLSKMLHFCAYVWSAPISFQSTGWANRTLWSFKEMPL